MYLHQFVEKCHLVQKTKYTKVKLLLQKALHCLIIKWSQEVKNLNIPEN